MDYQFRTQLNGFHKQDVIAYLEHVNNAHTTRTKRIQSQLAASEERVQVERTEKQMYIDKLSEAEAEVSRIKILSGVKIADFQDNKDEGLEEIQSLRTELEKARKMLESKDDAVDELEEEIEVLSDELLLLRNEVKKLRQLLGDK